MRTLAISLFLFLIAGSVSAQISFDGKGKWETDFGYSEYCTQRGLPEGSGNTDCNDINDDGIYWRWSDSLVDGNPTQTTADAQNPLSSGVRGARFWVGDGVNQNSGQIQIEFPTAQKELWIRWYMRYQEGFNWDTLFYNKTVYLRTAWMGDPGTSLIPSLLSSYFSLTAQGTSDPIYSFSDAGWDHTYGPGESDGSWHCFEVYIKMDTQSDPYDGIGRMWLDGQLMGEYTNINYSNNNEGDARNGWIFFDINNNQSDVDNANGSIGEPVAYVDYDDMVIYNQTPPNTDAQGNPFIGPIGWESINLQAPGKLRIEQ
jgi:hypothetical protein